MNHPTSPRVTAGPAALSLAERAARYLATLPPALSGSGGHDVTFRAACALVHGFNFDEATAAALLLSHYNPGCVPPWSPAEIAHKVRSAAGSRCERGRGYLLHHGDTAPTPRPSPATVLAVVKRWPDPDFARIRQIVAAGVKVRDLAARSPVPADHLGPADVLPALFADASNPDPLVCFGKSPREFATRPLSGLKSSGRAAEFAFIVPSPMSARTGDNVGPRRHLVVEFDFKPFTPAGVQTRWAPLVAEWRATGRTVHDACASLLWHLAGFAPLGMVVHSAGASLHGWFPTRGLADTAGPEKFFRYAVSLGADRATWNRSQLVRMPGGTRDHGGHQRVLYFDPGALAPVATVNGTGGAL